MKKTLGGDCALYPSLTTIVGATVEGRANFLAVAHIGIMNHGLPQYISVGLNKRHYTNQGIHDSKCFSVNIPSEALVAETDYVGIVTGKTTDKSGLFKVFTGQTGAPMISECPVCIDCRLERVVDFPTHEVFVGEIVEVYAEEDVLKNGAIDLAQVKPLLFDMASKKYWSLGQPVADCWGIGKTVKERLREE